MPTLNPEQKSSLQQVHAMIAPDIPEDYSPAETAELIIDAGRLTMFGFPEVDEQMRELARKDYSETLSMIVRELGL